MFELRKAPDRTSEETVQNYNLPFAFEDRKRRFHSFGPLELEGGCPEIGRIDVFLRN
jgi:hypothetical protein